MTIPSTSLRAMLMATICFPLANVAHSAEILSDGNFDSLAAGSAPDNGVSVGPWEIGVNPGHPDDIEGDPHQISIVQTSEFIEGAIGNSLSVSPRRVTTVARFNDRVRLVDNEILRATFDVFIPETETSGQPGFHLLLLGGDTFTRNNRGPQIAWNNGRIQANFCDEGTNCNTPRTLTAVRDTPVNQWQNVQMDIDLANDTYDLSWGIEGGPMELVAPYTRFRSARKSFLDRIAITYFNNVSYRRGNAYLDNIDMEILTKDWIGDANLDGEFDAVDIVEVLQAGKYGLDETAGWSQGDWNRDMRFDRLDILAALQDGGYGQGPLAAQTEQAAGNGPRNGPFAALQPDGMTGDAQTSIVYDAGSGELSLDAPAGVDLTSINVDSAAGIFTGVAAQNLGGSFDNDTDANIFKATFGGSFGSVSFGNVAEAGLSEQFVLGDLTVVGSLAGGGDLGSVDFVYVPEPAAIGLLALGIVVILPRFRPQRG